MRGILSHQLDELRGLATRQADDGPEGLVANLPDHAAATTEDVDAILEIFDRRYARGVADFLEYLAGEQPSVELQELLAIRRDV